MTTVSHMKMLHAEDPAESVRRDLGDVSAVDVLFNHVLLATYLRPEKTAAGVFLPDKVRDEDHYQGQVGLVVKLGPLAFISGPDLDIHGRNVAIGDWMVYRPSDGIRTSVNGRHCRLIQAEHLKMRVPSPDMVF